MNDYIEWDAEGNMTIIGDMAHKHYFEYLKLLREANNVKKI